MMKMMLIHVHTEPTGMFIEGRNSQDTPSTWRIPFKRNAIGRPTINHWKDKSPFDIWYAYFKKVLEYTLKCTNINIESNGVPHKDHQINMKMLLRYIAAQKLMGTYPLNDINLHWTMNDDYTVYGYKPPNLSKVISKANYWYVHKWLRFEDYDNLAIDKTYKAWKVKTIIKLFRESLNEMYPCPEEALAIDEGMLLDTSTRNPLGQHMSNKPITRGTKFYIVVCVKTKVVVDLLLEDGQINAVNSRDYNYGVHGRYVINLLAPLPGKGYKVFVDNLYTSVPLAAFLANSLQMYLIGTWRKKRGVPKCLIMSTAKKAKPTNGVYKIRLY